MINITTKIHDKFSIEFKVGFSGSERDANSNFNVNTWFFIPNSLDINSGTYGKDHFYRDVKSNIRLITPEFSMLEMVEYEAIPLNNLKQSLKSFLAHQIGSTDLEFQVKMFCAIFKSALRNSVREILHGTDESAMPSLCRNLVDGIQQVTLEYRKLVAQASETIGGMEAFFYGDEYMSHIISVQLTRAVRKLDRMASTEGRALLVDLIQKEIQYKEKVGYSHVYDEDDKANRELVVKHGQLKKYIESALFLKMDTSDDGAAVKQLTFGVAAGIAMLISTLIALPFQKYLGNYPALIFIILIVAYMFKDRIKEMMRNLFAYRLKSKFFDHKTVLHFKDETIGWIKEGMDFINDAKTPEEVLKLRKRSHLEADNALQQERTILYRKQVNINNQRLRNQFEYVFAGINDILRFHIQSYVRKMDDPILTIDTVNADGQIETIPTARIYNVHVVLQFIYDDQVEYRAFRIAATRDGILEVKELS